MLQSKSHLEFVVTGGAGFIGSNFLDHMVKKYPQHRFINLDALTYSGRLENVQSISSCSNYDFIEGDIGDRKLIESIIKEGTVVINFAAESHVDNSISDSHPFIKTNILGTYELLEAARRNKAKLFVQISTDEVYGSLNFESPSSTESDVLKPSSPYSSSKAAAEMLCSGNWRTFKQPIIITRSSNNFGPNQFPEKVIPLFVTNLIRGKKVPLYGEGKNMRDWIYVKDNCEAIETIIERGSLGQIYNIGGGNEISNLELTHQVLEEMGFDEKMISYVQDRPGHDLRYSVDCTQAKSLGWSPRFSFKQALRDTVDWYKNNERWWSLIKENSGKRTS